MAHIKHPLTDAPALPEWAHAFPPLHQVDDQAWRLAANQATRRVHRAGTRLFHAGEPCTSYIFIEDGKVKVFKVRESGQELVMYRLHNGDTCAATAAALMSESPYAANAITEEDTTIVFLPRQDFAQALDASKGFREYVCRTMGGRTQQLIQLLETVMVRNVKGRLARWLLERASVDAIAVSHQELAFELGTAREVVSRNLKKFEQNAWVRLARRSIEILDVESLSDIAIVPRMTDLSSLINVAGRQRMLSQRIAKSYMQINLGVDVASSEAELADSIVVFERQLAELKQAPMGSDIARELRTVEGLWGPVKAKVQSPPSEESARFLAEKTNQLLAACENVVRMLAATA